MSIEVLKNTRKPHSIHDDVESTFWVFYHTALHYFKIKKNNAPFKQPSLALFNECEITTGEEGQLVYVGGSKKVDTLTSGTIQKVFFESEPLTTALHKFATILSRHRTRRSILQLDPSESSQAVFDEVDQKIYRVEEIIEIFDSTIANADETSKWPEHDDAVEDQYKVKSTLDEHIQLAGAHEAHVTRSQNTSRKPVPQPDGDMLPPAFIPSRRVTRSVTRKNAKNAPPPVASGSGVPPSMSRSTSKRHRVGDEDAQVEAEESEGRTKRSRQQKTKAIARTASSEQKNYNTRSRTRSLKQGVES